MKLPAGLSIVGPFAIREAFAGDYQQLGDLLVGSLRDLFELAGDQDPWPYVRAVFADSVVVERDGKLWKYPYTVDGTTVTLGAPIEVTIQYVAADVAMREALKGGDFLEALDGGADKPASRFRIRVVKAGLSGNANFYPDAVLRAAVPLFEGVRVFVKGDAEHIGGQGKDFRNLIGRLVEPKFVEGKSAGAGSAGYSTDSGPMAAGGEIQAVLELLDPAGEEAVKLREAWARGMTALFGFSIDAKGTVKAGTVAGKPALVATKFVEVKSVDLIVEPGAGGRLIGLVEAKKETIMDREALIVLLEAKGLLKGKDPTKLTDADLTAILREAVQAAPASGRPANPTGGSGEGAPPAAVTPEQLDQAVRMVEARGNARAAIDASSLPAKAKEKLKTRFAEMATFAEADVAKAIKEEAEYLASFVESGRVRMGGLGAGGQIQAGETRFEKVEQMLDAFFDPNHKDHRYARSFRECYRAITGDRDVTGRLDNVDQALFRESLDSGSFANVLGNAITRRMIADYRDMGQYDVWRRIVGTPVPINDFRTNERTRYGGYGNLPIVGEGGPYLAQGSPTDEKATYAVQKRGGTEDVTLEMIKNDDVGAIQRIPQKLSRAAKRTLATFVLDFIRTNPVVYDGLALFHATHGNLGAAALDATSLAARRLAMLKQAELNSNDRIGIGPRGIMVPADLQEAAVNLFNRATNNDKTFVQALTLEVLPIWYWADTNDWALYADPADIPGLEIGFLDGNEEPELFVQDNPTVGSMFSNDKLTWKLRHIYGGNIVDYRAFDKSVVA